MSHLQQPAILEHRHTILDVLVAVAQLGGDLVTLRAVATALSVGSHFDELVKDEIRTLPGEVQR